MSVRPLSEVPPSSLEACQMLHHHICSHEKKDDPKRRHKCMGTVIIDRQTIILDCPLCGSEEFSNDKDAFK